LELCDPAFIPVLEQELNALKIFGEYMSVKDMVIQEQKIVEALTREKYVLNTWKKRQDLISDYIDTKKYSTQLLSDANENPSDGVYNYEHGSEGEDPISTMNVAQLFGSVFPQAQEEEEKEEEIGKSVNENQENLITLIGLLGKKK